MVFRLGQRINNAKWNCNWVDFTGLHVLNTVFLFSCTLEVSSLICGNVQLIVKLNSGFCLVVQWRMPLVPVWHFWALASEWVKIDFKCLILCMIVRHTRVSFLPVVDIDSSCMSALYISYDHYCIVFGEINKSWAPRIFTFSKKVLLHTGLPLIHPCKPRACALQVYGFFEATSEMKSSQKR